LSVEKIYLTNHFFDQVGKRFGTWGNVAIIEFLKDALKDVIMVKHGKDNIVLIQESFGTCIKSAFDEKVRGRLVLITVFDLESYAPFMLRREKFYAGKRKTDLSKVPIYWGKVNLKPEEKNPVAKKKKKKKVKKSRPSQTWEKHFKKKEKKLKELEE